MNKKPLDVICAVNAFEFFNYFWGNKHLQLDPNIWIFARRYSVVVFLVNVGIQQSKIRFLCTFLYYV